MSVPTDSAPTVPEAEDFRAECRGIHALMQGVDAAVWSTPTDFKGWTPYDVIAHLHVFDRAAETALEGAEAFNAYGAGFRQAMDAGESATAFTRRWVGNPEPAELLARWWDYAQRLADRYRNLDPRRRVPWGRGPDMSVRSCISARFMETWAHTQAIYDVLGLPRQDTDRIRNVAVFGVNTYDWTFRNRGLAPPQPKPFVSLVAPSGAVWSWNDADAPSAVRGAAVEFCQVVTQTRNIADTQLAVSGEAARQWMSIAQCFAGPVHDPPAPGTRRRRGS